MKKLRTRNSYLRQLHFDSLVSIPGKEVNKGGKETGKKGKEGQSLHLQGVRAGGHGR